MSCRAIGAVAVTAAALLLAACGQKNVDTAAIESGIKEQVKPANTTVSKVDCPSEVKSQQGQTFQCSITLANGGTGKVEVTQHTANKFSYALVPGSLQIPGSSVEKQIEDELVKAGYNPTAVNCPDNIIVKVGTYVVCDVTGVHGTGSVKFTFSDASGTVDTSSVEPTS